jgi:hypothetical protein
MGNWITIITESLKIAQKIYSDREINNDINIAIKQVGSLLDSIDLFNNAVVQKYIPDSIVNSPNYSIFQKDVTYYIFAGEIPEVDRSFSYKKNGNQEIMYSDEYKKMIKEVGSNIFNGTANGLKPYKIGDTQKCN